MGASPSPKAMAMPTSWQTFGVTNLPAELPQGQAKEPGPEDILESWLDNVKDAGRARHTVTFPTGDWFLGAGDGSVGRYYDGPAGGALIMKGSPADSDEKLRPPEVEMMSSDTGPDAGKGQATEQQAEQPESEQKSFDNNSPSGVRNIPWGAYGGELQLLEDHRSQSIRFSDLTDSSNYVCRGDEYGDGPHNGPAPTVHYNHPQIELDRPQGWVHVHLEDKAAGPVPHVLWDAVYDMGGTEVLKANAPEMWGKRPKMEVLCPPKHGPPHWYELTISKEGDVRRRPSMMQDFLGSQVITAYRPDHDPQLDAFSVDLDKSDAGQSKAKFL